MRIIDEVPHPTYKITIFKHEDRWMLKIEHHLLAQSYKYRDGMNVNSVDDIRALLTKEFYKKVEDIFAMMHSTHQGTMPSNDEDINFMSII